MRRYDDTPFGVALSGPVVTIARASGGMLRGWTQRVEPFADDEEAKSEAPQSIQLTVEFAADDPADTRIVPKFSLADSVTKLAASDDFRKVDAQGGARFVTNLYETVALKPGEMVVPVTYELAAAKEDSPAEKPASELNVVLRTARKAASASEPHSTGAVLIEGTLVLRLGHLCDQTGCVQHFYESLREVPGLGAIAPHPSLEKPGATIYLRAGEPIDVWRLREQLRDQSIEAAGIVPRDLANYRLRIELPRWRIAEEPSGTEDSSDNAQQCMACRDRAVAALEKLDWSAGVVVAGGGINFRPKDSRVDLVELLEVVADAGVAPAAVWLIPDGAKMPKAAPPRDVHSHAAPEFAGSQAHPIVEFELGHVCAVGTQPVSLLHQQKWASETTVDAEKATVARASIADRKYAGLSSLLADLRSSGHAPREIRLRDFGDIRIQLEFAHICGDVVYSKPPKPKKKKEAEKEDDKPKKPFVPQPVSMAETSNGRNAIKAAIESVSWVREGLFYDYHTKFEFQGGPRKITFALQAVGDDVVRLDELIDALREAGFPPKSVVVSRRFPGIPFGKPLPEDLSLTDRDGNDRLLSSFKKPGRPLAVAFVCLNTKSRKYGEYKADPKLYARLGKTIEAYQDRVDIVAISSNEHDEFPDVAKFWEATGLSIPLLHDAGGMAGKVFNMQIAPPPHLFVFDADGLHRYGGEPHSNWEEPEKEHEDYLSQALDLVLAGKYLDNGAVFFNKSLCNCSHPKCKCPKCGCGSTCRCGIKHCGVGF